MGNALFNTITVIFVALTLIVGLTVLMVASGSIESPILAPEDTQVPPTVRPEITLTPSPMPGMDLTLTAEATADTGS